MRTIPANAMNRRSFLQTVPAGMAAAALLQAHFADAQTGAKATAQSATQPAAGAVPAAPITPRTVFVASDAAPVAPETLLATLEAALARHPGKEDNYLKGGAVTELEHAFATMLGKEDCCMLPTGTLANNLAVRILCGNHKHLIVQQDSHLYADESDAPSIMSGLTMQPIAPGKAAPTIDEIRAAVLDAEHRAYPLKVGAISIESPVRRHDGESVPFATMQQLCGLSKEKGIGTHWDGARAFMLTGTPGFDMKRTAAQFDTVFVSLYKALHAPFGAMLAGPADTIAQARDLRHVFGGLIYHGWVAALPALDALDGFTDRWTRSRAAAEQVFAKLQAAGGYTVRRIPNESNIVYLQPSEARLHGLPARLQAADIRARITKEGSIPFFINDTMLHQGVDAITAAFLG